MIGHKQMDGKKTQAIKPAHVNAALEKKMQIAIAAGMVYDPELDKFSGDEFIPEKHKEAEIRLANSILPPFK